LAHRADRDPDARCACRAERVRSCVGPGCCGVFGLGWRRVGGSAGVPGRRSTGLADGCMIRAPIRQLRQKPQGPVSAAGAENRSFRAVGEEFVQLCETSLIVAGQVAVSLKDSGVVLNAVAFGDDGEACLK